MEKCLIYIFIVFVWISALELEYSLVDLGELFDKAHK